MSKEYYAGIDAHKSSCTITILDGDGNKIKDGKVRTEKAELIKFFGDYASQTTAVVETCYNWNYVYNSLKDTLKAVKVAHAYKIRIIAEAKVKNDTVDSRSLAHLLRTNFIPEIYVAPQKIFSQREIVRGRVYLVRIRTKLKNKVHAILAKNGLTGFSGTDLFGKAGREFLNDCPLPEWEKKAVNRYLSVIDSVTDEVKEFEMLMRNAFGKNPTYKLLKTIPGIGDMAAAVLLTEIADIKRFAIKEKLCSYAGLTPRAIFSGEGGRNGHISKQGNRYIRWIIVECATIAIRHSVGLGKLYQRLKEKRNHQIAIIAVARKMLEIAFHVWKSQDEYSEVKAFSGMLAKITVS